MSVDSAIFTPVFLTGFYLGDATPSILSAPYNLSSEYDKTIGNEASYLNALGDDHSCYGEASLSISKYNPRALTSSYKALSDPSLLSSPYDLYYSLDDDSEVTGRYISLSGFNNLNIGNHQTYNLTQYILPYGSSVGFFSEPQSVINSSRVIAANSWLSLAISNPLIYNLQQFIALQGKGLNHSLYGTPALLGGVKYIAPSGVSPLTINKPVATNTTANQTISSAGKIAFEAMPSPRVSPHMIYAPGIYGTSFGSAVAVPTPVLKQIGSDHALVGTATVWYHTRTIGLVGFVNTEFSYPIVFDPTQFIKPSAFIRTTVFGDTYAKNVWSFIKSSGNINDGVVTPWNKIENKNKSYTPKGFLSEFFGVQLIANKSPSIFFSGIAPPIFYSPSIGHRIQTVKPSSFDRLALGSNTVTKTPELLPVGISSATLGTQWISHRVRTLEASGKNASLFSGPVVWFRYRYVTAGKPWQSSVFSSSATITHGVREVIAQGFTKQVSGTPVIQYKTSYVLPTSINPLFATNHTVGRHQEVKPVSFIASLFGTRIIPEIQNIYPLGAVGAFGLAKTYLKTQYLKPIGYLTAGTDPTFRWGRASAYNLTSYIVQNFDGGNGLVPPAWSDWTAIANRNKSVGVVGQSMQRFGYSQINNNARLIQPIGLVATTFDKSMIAYRIRKLPIESIEAPYMAGWHVVHNAARPIVPTGVVNSLFGVSSLLNTRRYLDRIGRIETQEFGEPMVAFRIRTLTIEKRYTIEPPIIRLPTIDLWTRYVSFNGYETTKYGLAALSIHFRIITPRWTHTEIMGSPALKNVTPELLIKGHDSQEFGVGAIRTQWRTVAAQGDNLMLFGATKISDTKQFIMLSGFIDSASSQKHTLTQGVSAPYSKQYIYLNDENDSSGGEGEGIEPIGMPKPSFNQNVLYHSGHSSQLFGVGSVHSNNIAIRSGISIDNVPNGLIVSNKNNFISLDGEGIKNLIVVSKPRLSPHTIYAVMDAPAQAKQNHPTTNLHYVNSNFGNRAPGEAFGTLKIESTIRNIYPKWPAASSAYTFGVPKLTLSRSVIKTDGFRLGRFGVPKIPFSLQTITIMLGTEATLFGSTKAEKAPYYGPQTISPSGLNATLFGLTYSDNFIRTLYAAGKSSLLMGASKSGDTPYMWQGLRVGAFVPSSVGGGDMSRYGVTVVGLRVRELSIAGFNAFRSEYDVSLFYDRMTVSNIKDESRQSKGIATIGIGSTTAMGSSDVRLGQHFIRPDGNSDQHRKGVYRTPSDTLIALDPGYGGLS